MKWAGTFYSFIKVIKILCLWSCYYGSAAVAQTRPLCILHKEWFYEKKPKLVIHGFFYKKTIFFCMSLNFLNTTINVIFLITETDKNFKLERKLNFTQFCNFYRALGKISVFKNRSSNI